MVREEVTDEELCEDVDLSDDEEEEQKGAVAGAKDKKEYDCPDSRLSPSARIRLYSNQSWRMEVRHWYLLWVLVLFNCRLNTITMCESVTECTR